MTRTVQEEVTDVLLEFFSERHVGTSSRNVDIALYLYGFGGVPEPTLEAVAARFEEQTADERLSRERVRQILEKANGALSAAELPSVDAFVDFLSTASWWLNSELAALLVEGALVDEPFSVSGLLRLAKDTGRAADYTIRSPDFSGSDMPRKREGGADWARGVEEKCEAFHILDGECVPPAKRILKHARKFHRKYGLARVEDLLQEPECIDIPERHRILKRLLEAAEDAWLGSVGGATWYVFDDQRHVFKNVADKVFSVTDVCNSSHLAEACGRHLAGRKSKNYPHPPAPAALIRRYFETSTEFESTDGQVRYAQARRVSLGVVEKDLVVCLNGRPEGATGAQIHAYLQSRGHKKSSINAAIGKSPLVLRVGERAGPGYTYFLIGTGPDGSSTVVARTDHQRYVRYRQLLDRLARTDVDVEAKRRTEQKLLRRWLFDGKKEERCALCKRFFMVSELVAAHKKRRTLCNPAERRDPDIVMPLCDLGCDFVYEQRHVVVRDGITTCGAFEDCSEAVREYAKGLDGRTICDRWLAGKPWYFDNADRGAIR